MATKKAANPAETVQGSGAPAVEERIDATTGEVVKVEPGTGNVVATNPVNYDDMDAQDPNQREYDRDDVAVPRIKILQAQAYQLNRSRPEYVEGARAGMFFNTATEELWSPEPGLLVVPCAFLNSFTEWHPRATNKGLIADRSEEPEIRQLWREAFNRRQDNDRKVLLENGNEINHAAEHYVLLTSAANPLGPWQEAVLSFSGTQVKKSRMWNSKIEQKVLFRSNGTPFRPLPCAFVYYITNKPESNDQGQWIGWVIGGAASEGNPNGETLRWPGGPQLYARAKSFRELVLEGKRRAVAERDEEDRAPRGPAGPSAEDDPAESYDRNGQPNYQDGRVF